MKNLEKLFIIFSFIFAISLILPVGICKSYHYDYVKVDVYLQENGSVYVKQERDYNFDGSFSYAYIDFSKKGSNEIKILNIVDLESGVQPIYEINDGSESVKITWHYSADYEVKKFLIEYVIKDAMKKYDDVAEFYWKIIEDSHESIDKLDVNIYLPESSEELFKVFVHSSAKPGELIIPETYNVSYVKMEKIPANTFVEFRVLTSPNIFSISKIDEKKYENILNEEKGNFILYGTYGFFSSFTFLAILIAIPIIIFIFFYVKYGRDPKVDYYLKYEQEPPRDISPMELTNIMEGEEMGSDTDIRDEAAGLLATIFDLARRGYIEIKEEKKKRIFGESKIQVFSLTKKGQNKKERKKLKSFEQSIIHFIFSCNKSNRESNSVTSDDIKEFCQKNPYKIKKDISDIDKTARKSFEKKYFPIIEKSSERMNKIFWIFFASYAALFVIYSLIFFRFTSFLFLPVLIVLGIVGFFISKNIITRRTIKSTLEVKRWKAFKRFITDFSAMEEAPPILLHIWDKYLVYAISLGVAKKLLKNIKNLSIQRHVPISAVAWYGGGSKSISTMNMESMSGFIDSLSSTISSLSSSTSVGGGFSGGGGGGGGGGGSGAG